MPRPRRLMPYRRIPRGLAGAFELAKRVQRTTHPRALEAMTFALQFVEVRCTSEQLTRLTATLINEGGPHAF